MQSSNISIGTRQEFLPRTSPAGHSGGPLQSLSAKTLIDVQSGIKFAKCPLWDRQRLLFLDVHDRCIKSTDLKGRLQTVERLPFVPGGFGILPHRGMIVGDALRRKIFLLEKARPGEMADLSEFAGFSLSDGIINGRSGMIREVLVG